MGVTDQNYESCMPLPKFPWISVGFSRNAVKRCTNTADHCCWTDLFPIYDIPLQCGMAAPSLA